MSLLLDLFFLFYFILQPTETSVKDTESKKAKTIKAKKKSTKVSSSQNQKKRVILIKLTQKTASITCKRLMIISVV